MEGERRGATVLVIADDAELGGLVAMNLRQRGLMVEQTDLTLALASRWAPCCGLPDLIVLDVEAADRVSPSLVQRLTESPWARGVPWLVLADDPARLTRSIDRSVALALAHPTDVGALVGATHAILDRVSVS